MTSINEIILLSGMVVVTFSIRYILVAFSNKYSLPGEFEKYLEFVPPAVLTALIVPAVFMPEGSWNISFGNAYLVSGSSAAIAGFVFPKKTLAASISTGLAVFFLIRLLSYS